MCAKSLANKPAEIAKLLLGKEQEARLQAVLLTKALPDTQALRLLRKGLGHWDRKLRAACLVAMAERSPRKAAMAATGALNEKRLPKWTALEILSSCDCQESVARLRLLRASQEFALQDAAIKAMCHMNCPAALLERITQGIDIESISKRHLNRIPTATLQRVFRRQSQSVRERLLEDRNWRRYPMPMFAPRRRGVWPCRQPPETSASAQADAGGGGGSRRSGEVPKKKLRKTVL